MSDSPVVAAHRTPSTSYDVGEVRQAVRGVARSLGWFDGSETSGAFASLLPLGARVLVKPNLVLHENKGPWGVEPLFTHLSLIRAVVEELLASGAARVIVGDAPLQECDFDRLLAVSGLGAWAAELSAREPRFVGPMDYRRTKARLSNALRVEQEGLLPIEQFVLFDLAEQSLLEPIAAGRDFRVTQYPPADLARTHQPGRHQYLVYRDIIEADVVINLPKLKTHKKAGITCALKNLIGINGNKEFLPHHRLGGTADGGDCYPGGDPVKRALESAYDQANSTRSLALRRMIAVGTRVLNRMLHMKGDELGVEGAWSGNDTIWRTCLDLNRVLLYGRTNGSLADERQRRVVHIVDGIVGGQGDGPLHAEPLEMGLVLAGESAAAVDLVGSLLLGYSPQRIPIVAHAFDSFRWPLTDFSADEVRVTGALGEGTALERVHPVLPPDQLHIPAGWRDAVADPEVVQLSA